MIHLKNAAGGRRPHRPALRRAHVRPPVPATQLPAPDINPVSAGTHAEQTGAVLRSKEFIEHGPDVVVVYGDVNSTMAATLAAAKLHIPVAHVEAGLRSFDRTMPEEINRLVTDQLAAYLFTPSPDGDANLIREGVAEEKIFRVGNVMIDTLVGCMPLADAAAALGRLRMSPGDPFVLVTLHRPANVDAALLTRRCPCCRSSRRNSSRVSMPANSGAGGRARPQLDAAPYGSGGLSRVARASKARAARDYGFRRRAGRNDLSRCALSHGAAEHRAARHDYRRHERARRHGSEEPAEGRVRSLVETKAVGQDPRPLGRACGRANRRSICQETSRLSLPLQGGGVGRFEVVGKNRLGGRE